VTETVDQVLSKYVQALGGEHALQNAKTRVMTGTVTKRDLSSIGAIAFMGIIGIIVASVINIFLHSSALSFAVSAIGVLVFAGLTAYDTQKIKEMYFEGDASDVAGRKAIMGALTLYLDFINMFQFMLSFMGDRR